MALHIIGRRTQEIGVRKTLGASVNQIFILLLGVFSKPIVIANLAVWPLVYLVMQGYLSLFARSTSLTLLPFLLSLLLTLVIAWLAVAVQASRAARMNPASVLRYE
jgi:putative ABC transport system permease protein